MSGDHDIPPAGAAANLPANPPGTPPANPPVNPPAKPADRAPGRASDKRLRHRVDGDVLRVWPADDPEPEPYHTPEMHAVELLRWLSSRYPAGVWVATSDIQRQLYPAFLRERGWAYQPLSTIYSHLKKLTRCREKDMDPGRREHHRFVQTQYEIPKPAADVVEIEAARKRA